MKVNCNECQKDFLIDLKEKKHPKGIIETYFVCTHCKNRFIAFVTNQNVRKKQHQMRKLQSSIPQIKHPSEYTEAFLKKLEDHYSKINNLKAELESEMKILKEQIASK
ncbi:hypothetical protein KHA94_00195 [Bacillus sp. FJAT-49705]|uniref:Transglycosylase n=1 Tax=Cytobacillus citreus TaxID=2833586 RepID=A0ABS5NMD6_9BACI|nr:hypothetical protein [Cytobacillus citreus]MBS4188639.1 hypothetical protein [Cytobacillus citreus]